jgi:hypothetical protein
VESKRFFIVFFAIALIAGGLAGCGDAGERTNGLRSEFNEQTEAISYKSSSGFSLGGYYYKIDSITYSSDSSEVVFLLKQREWKIPVQMTLGGGDMTSLLEISFVSDGERYTQSNFTAAGIDEENWKGQFTFKLQVPPDTDIPEYVTLTALDSSKESVDVDIKDVPVHQ